MFLNQLQLSKDDKEANDSEEATKTRQSTSLPASLINTYFHLFEMTVKKDDASRKKKGSKQSKSLKGDSSSYQTSRLLSALLTGVNRAHPYLPKKDAAMEQHIDALELARKGGRRGRPVHASGFPLAWEGGGGHVPCK